MNAQSKITRISRSGIPRASSANALAAPKLKMSGRVRRQLMRSRDLEVVGEGTEGQCYDATEPIHPAVKMTMRLSKLPLVKVLRRQHQFARRASTARHLALKMSESSPFRPAMQRQHSTQLGFFKQATAEINARMLAVQNRLAAATI